MEDLKPFEKLLTEDERWAFFMQPETVPHNSTAITLKYIYNKINSIDLLDDVPDEIKSQFNIAKMIAVYSWFYYPFHQISELKAYSTLEFALRHKYKDKGGNLNTLLRKAVKDKDGIVTRKDYPEILHKLRNDLAHGSTTLHPNSEITLRNCADIINALFKPKK